MLCDASFQPSTARVVHHSKYKYEASYSMLASPAVKPGKNLKQRSDLCDLQDHLLNIPTAHHASEKTVWVVRQII